MGLVEEVHPAFMEQKVKKARQAAFPHQFPALPLFHHVEPAREEDQIHMPPELSQVLTQNNQQQALILGVTSIHQALAMAVAEVALASLIISNVIYKEGR